MADFCKQCALHMWGEEIPSDFVGIQTPEVTAQGLYTLVLCEGCGGTQVDHEGTCMYHETGEHDKKYWTPPNE